MGAADQSVWSFPILRRVNMSKKLLYLHIGWSKTGTSAIQANLDQQFAELKSQGILYSKKMQMNDHAHHHFALAFAPIHGYPAKYTIDQTINMLNEEMEENNCESLLLSSELSPFYFNNPKFCEWVKRFDEIKIIATVRRQSELFLSLFNQLVKDPQVRYKGSFFQLAISNFPKMNFFQHLTRWSEKVSDDNIIVINYDDDVVKQFLSLFSLSVDSSCLKQVINPSLPVNTLRLMQSRTKNIEDPNQYRNIRDLLINEYQHSKDKPDNIFLTKGELDTIDNHFAAPNNVLAKRFMGKPMLFELKVNQTIYVY